jgi:hypothetical protein
MTLKNMTRVILIISIIFQGFSGVLGGVLLLFDPTGKILNLPIEFLADTPFSNYFIPGLILFTALGISPLIVSYGLIKRKSWSKLYSIIVGIILLIWIAVEIIMIGYKTEPPLQLIYGVVGLIITIFSSINLYKQ